MTYDDFPCREVVELISDYLEGVLSPDVSVVVERHLAMCAGCAAYLDQMREAIRLTGTLHEDDVPAEVMASLLEAYRSLRD